MPSTDFLESDVHYAYSAIHNFFDVFSMHEAIQYVESSLVAATGNKMWKREVPAHLLFFIEKLQGLCNAAFTLYYDFSGRKETLVEPPENGVPDILVTANFLDSNVHSNPWNNFPRSLSALQYHYPYKAIAKFCKHMDAPEWANFFKALIEFALSESRINDDDYAKYNILKIRRRLLQLIEACHLIKVRKGESKKALQVNNETTSA